jgi:hypothetical protein
VSRKQHGPQKQFGHHGKGVEIDIHLTLGVAAAEGGVEEDEQDGEGEYLSPLLFHDDQIVFEDHVVSVTHSNEANRR